MKVWMYYRLSKDEDPELNSLTNQRNILMDYAIRHDYKVVGESFDDNYSGMNFDRPGIQQVYEEAQKKSFDAVLVKDLSRLGRHRTETAVFIESLLKKGISVISATENLNSSNEDDDMMIGFKGMFNDFYARDISRKVKAGLAQKQREGLVILPPMGFKKDMVTKEVTIYEEAAEIIREIYDLCLLGYGYRSIANTLTAEGKPTPRYYQDKLYNRSIDYDYPDITKRGVWNARTVKDILTNEIYCGTLVNHKFRFSKINKTRTRQPKDTWIKHENYFDSIIDKETFDKVQNIIELRSRRGVKSHDTQKVHRYAGLLVCEDCGCVLSSKIRRYKGNERVEYVCNGYVRFGKEHCTPHKIDESILDNLITSQLTYMLGDMEDKVGAVEAEFKAWMKDKGKVQRKIDKLNEEYDMRKNDQRTILLERLRDREHYDVYADMLKACEDDLKRIDQEISDLENLDATMKRSKSGINNSIDLLRKIIAEKEISDTNLRLLVDKIIVGESDGKLSIQIILNGNFESMTLVSGSYMLEEAILGSECKNRILTRKQAEAAAQG